MDRSLEATARHILTLSPITLLGIAIALSLQSSLPLISWSAAPSFPAQLAPRWPNRRFEHSYHQSLIDGCHGCPSFLSPEAFSPQPRAFRSFSAGEVP